MTDHVERPEAPRWLLEPPAPGAIHVYLNVGREAALPPAFLERLDALLRAIERDDTSGYRFGESCEGRCTGFTSNPCWTYEACPALTCASKLCQPYTCRIQGFTLR
jgi:hypothetical protein